MKTCYNLNFDNKIEEIKYRYHLITQVCTATSCTTSMKLSSLASKFRCAGEGGGEGCWPRWGYLLWVVRVMVAVGRERESVSSLLV